MNTIDKKVLRLIELLIFQNKIETTRQFCYEVGVLEQTISKIKKGTNHFTIAQIETICKIYNVNPNWLFDYDKKVFRDKKSIEL